MAPPTRRTLIWLAAALPLVLPACGDTGPQPLYVVRTGSQTVKVFVDGQSGRTRVETKVPEGGTWAGDVNGVKLSLNQGRLSIQNELYVGPPFAELHVIIKTGGTYEARVAVPQS